MVGEDELGLVRPVGQGDAFKLHLGVGAVPQFEPVGEVSVFIGHRRGVGAHHLADHQAVVQGYAPPAGVHVQGFSGGLLGGYDDQQDDQRRAQNQEAQPPVLSFDAACSPPGWLHVDLLAGHSVFAQDIWHAN